MLYFNEPIFYGYLLKRYRRFFMDVLLDDGKIVTAHTPNTGSMMGLLQKNNRLMLTKSSNPLRKTQYTVQAILIADSFVGINTHLPNKLIKNSLNHPLLADLAVYDNCQGEVRYGKDLRSRIDWYFFNNRGKTKPLFLEIKNVTLGVNKYALFPDAISKRAQKHIEELLFVQKMGLNAALFFIVQRQDVDFFSPAKEIDEVYAKMLKAAHENKLKIRALCAKISAEGLCLTHELPCIF